MSSFEALWQHPRGRAGLVLLAFAVGVGVAGIFSDTENSASDIVVVIGSLRFPALVLGFVLLISFTFRLRRVHWIAAGVALACAGLQTLASIAQGFEQRDLEDAVNDPAGWALLLLFAMALVPLVAPAERREEFAEAPDDEPGAQEEPAAQEGEPAAAEEEPAAEEPSAEQTRE